MSSVIPSLTTRRPMGIETEFGIVHTSDSERERSGANASTRLSHYAVAAYALLEDSPKRRVRWDYGDETPLRDARGFEVQRAAAHPTQLTHEAHDAHVPSVDADFEITVGDDIPLDLDDAATLHFAERRAIGNAVLTNGARLYVDHAHPEYSSPEVMTAREAVVWDKAGERIARLAMARIEEADGIPALALFKNNTDGKGQSYGTHENYLVDRGVPFERLCEILIPFFATRQILVGAGRVGIGTRGGARDDAQSANRQLSRRVPCGFLAISPAARHYWRCEPLRDLNVPQARDDFPRFEPCGTGTRDRKVAPSGHSARRSCQRRPRDFA